MDPKAKAKDIMQQNGGQKHQQSRENEENMSV